MTTPDEAQVRRVVSLVMPMIQRAVRENLQQAAQVSTILPLPIWIPATVATNVEAGADVSVVLDVDVGSQAAINAQNMTGGYLRAGQRVMVMKLAPHGAYVTNVFGNASALPAGLIMGCMAPTAPVGFSFSYSQVTDRSGAYSRLFAAIGTQYNTGGEAADKFRWPDLRGCVPMFLDNMGGSDRGVLDYANTLGAFHGEQYHHLTGGENGPHTHGLDMSAYDGSGNFTAVGRNGPDYPGNGSTGGSGSGDGHNNVQPSIMCNGVISI